MKRVVLSSAALLAALVLPGCPVYPEERGCFTHEDCRGGEVCSVNGNCVIANGGAGGAGGAGGSSSGQCDEPSDCRGNQTCGRDRRCHVGDCTFHGCVSGFECRQVEGDWACARSGGGTGGSAGYGDAAVDSEPDAAGSGGMGTDASDGAVPDARSDADGDAPGDSGSDAQTDAPRDSATDARDSATDARDSASDARDSASDAPRG
jgi:hypothetical protein